MRGSLQPPNQGLAMEPEGPKGEGSADAEGPQKPAGTVTPQSVSADRSCEAPRILAVPLRDRVQYGRWLLTSTPRLTA